MPGVLLLEAAAQLAGIVAQSDPAIPPLAALKLTALRQAKILGSARPGQVVALTATVEGRMGGLIQARDLLRLSTELVGVVSTEAPAYAESVAHGRVVATDTALTVADGMATRMPAAAAVDIIRGGAARILRVSDDEVAITVAPMARASCSAKIETPPVPSTSTLSPALMPPSTTSARHAVRPAVVSVAASG